MAYTLSFPAQHGAWEHELFTEFAAYLGVRGLLRGTETVESLHHSRLLIRRRYRRRFVVLDCHDWVTPFDSAIETLAQNRSCARILKAQYRPEPYAEKPLTKVRPWTYFPTSPARLQALAPAPTVVRDRLFFRGNTRWAQREPVLAALAGRGLVGPDYGAAVGYEQYLRELAGHRVALALPGMGNLCHREIEAFALGVPVLMPRLRNELHDPLIADQHYLSVDVDVEQDDPEHIAGRLADRYLAVRGQTELLRRVAASARAWWERNARIPDAFALTLRLAGL